MNNGLFGAVRVLEYMSINQSFLLGVSVLSYAVSIASSCVMNAVRLIVV